MPWLPTIDEYRKIARCHGGYYKAKNPPTTPNKLTRWICKYGHRFQLSLKQIIDEDKWCPICAENHIITTALLYKIINILKQKYPVVFNNKIILLEDEIYKSINIDGYTQEEIKLAIDLWQNRNEYIEAMRILGMPKYDLYGNISSYVNNIIERETKRQQTVQIYIDGSSNEDMDATWAFAVFNNKNVLIYQNSGKMSFTHKDKNITHKIELHAAIMALQWFLTTEYKDAIIYYDNNYVDLNTADSKNKNLMKVVAEYRSIMEEYVSAGLIKLEHVKSHTGNIFNEYVDGLCTLAYNIPTGKAKYVIRLNCIETAKKRHEKKISRWIKYMYIKFSRRIRYSIHNIIFMTKKYLVNLGYQLIKLEDKQIIKDNKTIQDNKTKQEKKRLR